MSVFDNPGVFVAWGLNNGQFNAATLGAFLYQQGIRWVAVQDTSANRVAPGAGALGDLRAAGLSAGIWIAPSQEDGGFQAGISFWNPDFYILQDEGPSEVPGGPAAFTSAFRALYPSMDVGVVTNNWFDAAYAAPYVSAGFKALPEAYQNENPPATPPAVAGDSVTRGWSGSDVFPVIGVWGGYSANNYTIGLQAFAGKFSIYLAEGTTDADYQILIDAGLMNGPGGGGPGGGDPGSGGGRGGAGGVTFSGAAVGTFVGTPDPDGSVEVELPNGIPLSTPSDGVLILVGWLTVTENGLVDMHHSTTVQDGPIAPNYICYRKNQWIALLSSTVFGRARGDNVLRGAAIGALGAINVETLAPGSRIHLETVQTGPTVLSVQVGVWLLHGMDGRNLSTTIVPNLAAWIAKNPGIDNTPDHGDVFANFSHPDPQLHISQCYTPPVVPEGCF